jgi:hypothetical protein
MEAVELAGAVDFSAFGRRERNGHIGSFSCPLVGHVDDLNQALAGRPAVGGAIDGDLNRLRMGAGWQPQHGTTDHHCASKKPN